MSKRIVITGMGALTPIGNNLSAYLDGLKSEPMEPALLPGLMPQVPHHFCL